MVKPPVLQSKATWQKKKPSTNSKAISSESQPGWPTLGCTVRPRDMLEKGYTADMPSCGLRHHRLKVEKETHIWGATLVTLLGLWGDQVLLSLAQWQFSRQEQTQYPATLGWPAPVNHASSNNVCIHITPNCKQKRRDYSPSLRQSCSLSSLNPLYVTAIVAPSCLQHLLIPYSPCSVVG